CSERAVSAERSSADVRFFCLSASRARGSSPLLSASSARRSQRSTSARSSSPFLASCFSAASAETTSRWPPLTCSSISSRLSSMSFLSSSALSRRALRLLWMTFPIRSKMPMRAYLAPEVPPNLTRAERAHALARPRAGAATLARRRANESNESEQARTTANESERSRIEGGLQMAVCKECGEQVDTLETVKIDGKAKKLCEDCADRARETAEVAEQSEAVVQNMMGFKGRR